ncbi:MAG: hypothetical protein PHQ87_11465 [Hydrogenophaga sp.]|uniref:hypothetical protein n=1 Tax=Hydrogenophaga sp. TaxID=1904254 RepID=UPI00261998C9|nr:hypothetical protein [Hydrogenophaga sp.]MDD3786155.1 hypothetical protein [Hydrogenophaga sp.]
MNGKRDLIAEVVRRTGIRIDEDDPAFAVAHLADLVLQEHTEKIAADLAEVSAQVGKDFDSLVEKIRALQNEGAAHKDENGAKLDGTLASMDKISQRLLLVAKTFEAAESAKAANIERNSQAIRASMESAIKTALPKPDPSSVKPASINSVQLISLALSAVAAAGVIALLMLR